MAVPGPTVRRLMKEAQELSEFSPSPSPYFHAHPISDSNLFDWHFTLAGPPEPSPYANGIYHGRIILSPQYPLRPPSFRFLTPSGRFEVNREICLSISGHHDETWQPAWGIRTALTAIRSFMDGDVQGQVGGLEAKEEVRRDWAKRSREWRCDVCPGRKTNEEILKEWWEVCKSKGVAVDSQEDRAMRQDDLPEGLKVGYKDEMHKNGDSCSGNQHSVGSQIPKQSEAQQPGGITSLTGSTNERDTSATSATAAATPLSRPTPTIPITNTQPASDVRRRAPGRTHAGATSNHTTSTASQTEDGPWLDRAIIGVVVALVIMVLKKVFYASSDDKSF